MMVANITDMPWQPAGAANGREAASSGSRAGGLPMAGSLTRLPARLCHAGARTLGLPDS